MTIPPLNHALQRTRRERRGCSPCVLCAGSLSLGRWRLTFMHRFIAYFSLIAATMILGGCVVPLSPLTDEARIVSPVAGQTNMVVFKEPEVWYDQALFPSRGILLPQGTYRFESEDSEYRYFRAPDKIEYRTLKGSQVIDDLFIPGGLFLSKRTFDLVPAGAYRSVNEHTNVLTWKLGRDFINLEGGRWSKNF
jgi:hypothetical protein